MQNLTTEQKSHLYEGGHVGVTVTGETLDGDPIALTEDDIIEGSFSIDRNWTSGGTVEIGCAETSELIFELDNTDGRWSAIRWEGARLTVVLDIDGEPLQAGIFTVDEPPRKLTTMQIRALDDMARFNRPYVPGVAFPASLKQILLDCCTQCNVALETLDFTNGDYVVSQAPAGDDITFHHVVGWIAELAGCCAWIDELARLRLSWYGDQQPADTAYFLTPQMIMDETIPALKIGPDDRFSYELAETDIKITGIVYRTTIPGEDGADDEEIDYLAGTDDYALVIEDNPLLQGGYEALLNVLLSKLENFSYRPYDFETLSYPHLWPGDKVTKIVDAENNEHTSIITNTMFRLNANSRIEARGETETVRGYATGAPFTPSQKRVLQAVARVEAARKTSNIEQATLRLNELMVNSLGYFETMVENPATGARQQYIHDQPNLEESAIIWTMTEQGFAWTDQGWNDGSPVWQYGVTADGNAIVRLLDVVGLRAEWIHIGASSTFDTGYDPSEKETPDGAQSKADAAANAAQAAAEAHADSAAASAIAGFVNNIYTGDMANLESLIDGKIDTWFYPGTPTLNNAPASDWTTTALRDKHLDDLYYDTGTGTTAGYVYRFTKSGSVYSWERIKDADITAAMGAASAAQDTADGKRRVFTTTPTPPYDIGDLWAGGSSGDLKRCKTKKTAGQSYAAADWEAATKYTDDTAASAAATAASAAQSKADAAQSKADTAHTAATTAQTAANSANSLLADISSDSKLTPSEKQAVKKEWDGIVAEKPTIEAQAATYSITTAKSNYTAAYNTLSTYITPLLNSLATTSTIVGSTFRTNFKNYYDKRTVLLKAISDAAKTYADSVSSSAKTEAKTYSDEILQALADGTYGGGVFIDGNKIMAPELYGAKIEGVDIKGASGTFDGFRLGLPQYAHIEASGGVPYPFEELGAPDSVSGSATVRGAAENVFDGNPNTYWYGETGIIYDAAVMFDYNEPVCIKKVVAQAPTKDQVPETITRTMTLQYRDGSTWKSVGKVDLPRGENGESFVNPDSIFSTKWRLVNFWVLGILNYAGIMNVKLYGGVLDEAAATIKGYTGSIAGNQKSFELSGAGAFLRSDYFFIDDQPAMEKGENFNGSWVRWSNGLQICLYGWGQPVPATSTSSKEWRYPASFTSIPILVCGGGAAGQSLRLMRYGFNMQSSTTTSVKTELLMHNEYTSAQTCSMSAVAIGWWK